MIIGIIGPSKEEIMPFIEKIEHKVMHERAMLKFHTGDYAGVSVVAVVSGVCKVNAAIAAQILIDRFDVTHIIITGVAGGLHDGLRIDDTVISSEIAYHDVKGENLTEYHPWMEDIYFKADRKLIEDGLEAVKTLDMQDRCQVGRIITGEYFITENERAGLIERFTPLCVDMESASVAHTCHVNGIPFLAIRSISDNANEHGTESFENNVESASLVALSLVEALIKQLVKRGPTA